MPRTYFVNRRVPKGALITNVERATIIPSGMYGMGDWREVVAEWIAGDKLDKVSSAVFKLEDRLIDAIEARNRTFSGYKEAKALLDEATAGGAPLTLSMGMGIPVPNPVTYPAYLAFATARKGVQILARQVQTLQALTLVFRNISMELSKSGIERVASQINLLLGKISRFVAETDGMFQTSGFPEYLKAKEDIMDAVRRVWASSGVARDAVGDERWLSGYIRGANEVVPIPQEDIADEAASTGLGDPFTLLAILALAIGGIVATIVALKAISMLIPDQNSKANATRELLLKYQAQKSQEAQQMRAAGKSEAEIKTRMDEIAVEEKEAVEQVPEPGSLTGPIVVVLVAAIAAKAAGVF